MYKIVLPYDHYHLYITIDITVKDMTSVLLDNLSNIRHACPSIDRKDILNGGIYTAHLVTSPKVIGNPNEGIKFYPMTIDFDEFD
ncbi:hypothetical protein QTP88_005278 [Uroleucon formosanum]